MRMEHSRPPCQRCKTHARETLVAAVPTMRKIFVHETSTAAVPTLRKLRMTPRGKSNIASSVRSLNCAGP
eukprot:5353622-Alexandrium_andersonii.AAC.1